MTKWMPYITQQSAILHLSQKDSAMRKFWAFSAQIVVVDTTIQHSWVSHVLSEIFETQHNDFSGRGASQNTYKHVLNFYDDNGKRFICPNKARGSNYVARPRFVCFVHRKISEKCNSRHISGNKGPMTTLERLAIDSRGWIHSLIWVLASNKGFGCIVYC